LLTTGEASKPISNAAAYNANQCSGVIQLNPEMRAIPTIDITTVSSGYRYVSKAANTNFDTVALDISNSKQVLWAKSGLSGMTSGSAGWLQTTSADSYMAFTAEL